MSTRCEVCFTAMKIQRDSYLSRLIGKKHNGLIKIVSGVRRCGKSYLLFTLFREHLLESGVQDDHIITLALDGIEEMQYREPLVCYKYVKSKIRDDQMHYLLLDEVQFMKEFESVLNSFLRIPNLDVYITGSNSRFLSTDVVTEFRGRGDEVRVFPLSFSEFYSTKNCYWERAWQEYALYGGMPYVLSMDDVSEKRSYLKALFEETYLRDIIERHKLRKTEELDELKNILASGIGCLLNPRRLSNTFGSVKKLQLSATTIKQYLDYFQDSFLIQRAERYDVRGNQYIDSPYKYYYADMGLRNACINFRQIEESHIMENIIYNELLIRGCDVDVGALDVKEVTKNGKRTQKRLEVDFVVNRADVRIYIQSALAIPTREKRVQEERPLLAIRDAFKKVLIVRDAPTAHYDDAGVYILPLDEFLLNPSSLLS